MSGVKKLLAAMSGAVVAAGLVSAPGWAQSRSAGGNKTENGTASAVLTVADGNPGAQIASRPGSGQLVVDWNKELLKIEQTPGAQPATIHPTRSFALLHTAIYDAVVSITHADAPYAFSVVAPRRARPDAAADQAAHDTLAALFPAFGPELNQMLGSELASVPDGQAKQAGIAVGSRAATIILALRANDGSAATPPPLTPGDQPGDYQVTPPNLAPPVFTNWGTTTP